nr:RNA-directed DNA polymerase, eukaryota, reverse transcriptase zinc-binding domain protein [Tanacetum cinerariifolium]
MGEEFQSIIASFRKKQTSLNKPVYIPNNSNDGLSLNEDSNDENDGNEVPTSGKKDSNVVTINEVNVNSRNDGGPGLKSGEDTSPNVVKNTYHNLGISSTGLDTTGSSVQKGDMSQKMINFRTLVTPTGNGVYVVTSKESVCTMNERLCSTVYGFFLGECVAYLVVENYIKNTWRKFGLVKSLMTKGRVYYPCLGKVPWASYARSMIELRADIELKD